MEKSFESFYNSTLENELYYLQQKRPTRLFIFSKIMSFFFITGFLIIFVGFLSILPIHEFGIAGFIIKGFLFLVLSVVLFTIINNAIKKDIAPAFFPALNNNTVKRTILVIFILAAIITIAFFAGRQIFGKEFNHALFFNFFFSTFGLFIIGGIMFILNLQEKKFTRLYKQTILPKITKFIDKSISYENEKFIEQEEFINSKIFRFQEINSYKGSDLICGIIQNNKYRFSEIIVREKTTYNSGSSSKTEYKELFKGLFYVTELNMDLKGETILVPNYISEFLGSALAAKLNKIGTPENTKILSTSNEEFNKEFAVYTSDSNESIKLLSDSLMKNLINLHQKLDKGFYASFINKKLYLALPYNSDIYKPNMIQSLIDLEKTQKQYQFIKSVIDIIVYLHLNTEYEKVQENSI